jgi:hypothetical protein
MDGWIERWTNAWIDGWMDAGYNDSMMLFLPPLKLYSTYMIH